MCTSLCEDMQCNISYCVIHVGRHAIVYTAVQAKHSRSYACSCFCRLLERLHLVEVLVTLLTEDPDASDRVGLVSYV